MTEEKANTQNQARNDFEKLLEKDSITVPQTGNIVKGIVVSASKSEVRLDLDGVLIGTVRGPELYEEAEEYANLKPGDEIEATVIDEENENGEVELSFRYAGQKKAWAGLVASFEDGKTLKVKIIDANKGGLLAHFRQIQGFLPVSQLAPENYPRVGGGDKGKILEKLRSFIGKEIEVKVVTLEEEEDKIIFSEKDVWTEKQKDTIEKYKVGTKVEGVITAVTDFGVFISFGENMEGLIHISELAWQRIDNPSDLYKVGDKIKAEVISTDKSKIFLSAKKLIQDPWENVEKKYKIGQVVEGRILKVNPFGLFVELDENIHGLAHATQLDLAPGQKVSEIFKADSQRNFEVVTIEPKQHRLGLKLAQSKKTDGKKIDKDSLTKSASQQDSEQTGSEKKEDKKTVKKVNKKEKQDKNKAEKVK